MTIKKPNTTPIEGYNTVNPSDNLSIVEPNTSKQIAKAK